MNTKVDLRFHVASAKWLPEHVRQKILQRVRHKGKYLLIQLNHFKITLFSVKYHKAQFAFMHNNYCIFSSGTGNHISEWTIKNILTDY